MEMQTFKIQKTVDSQIIESITNSLNTIVEEYEIRLTPAEHKMLVDSYIDRYVKNIDISGLIQLSENIINQKKLK